MTKCRHCHKPIVQVNWASGPGWMHEGTRSSVCTHLRAEPTPTACGQCGWVGVGECPRGPGDHE